MGSVESAQYKSKQNEIMKNLGKGGDASEAVASMKVKRDGTQLRMKEVMLRDYD